MSSIAPFLCVLLLPAIGFGQLPSSRCDSIKSILQDCAFLTPIEPAQNVILGGNATSADLLDPRAVREESSSGTTTSSATNNDLNTSASMVSPEPPRKQGFHWRGALLESFIFLSIEQAYVVKDDFSWVTIENGVPLNHYWRDYKQSLSTWIQSGWDDGDSFLTSYIGHPIQGALTSYIQVQMTRRARNWNFPIPRLTGEVALRPHFGMRPTAPSGISAL